MKRNCKLYFMQYEVSASSRTLAQIFHEVKAGVRVIGTAADELLSYSKQPSKIYNLTNMYCRTA